MDTRTKLRILLEPPKDETLVNGTRVEVRGREGTVVKPYTGSGRRGKFDPRREVAVRIGRRVTVFRKGDVVVSG